MTPKILHKAILRRYILVVIMLLGIVLPHAKRIFAYDVNAKAKVEVETNSIAATVTTIIKEKHSPEPVFHFESLKLKLLTGATIPHLNFMLQQAAFSVLIKSFAFPVDEIIPAYAVILPGISFIAQIVPITILPNAP